MDNGASSKLDRAVVNGAASVSALRASVPSAAALFEGRYHGKGLTTSHRSGAEGRQSSKLRRLLVKDQGGRCAFCRRRMTPSERGQARDTAETLEHLVRRSLGGPLCASNCVAACHACNRYREWAFRGRVGLAERIINLLRHLSGKAEVAAQAIEARQRQDAKTGFARKGESAVPKGDAPNA